MQEFMFLERCDIYPIKCKSILTWTFEELVSPCESTQGFPTPKCELLQEFHCMPIRRINSGFNSACTRFSREEQ